MCSSLTGAIGSALAYISYIELVATLVIVSFFVGTGMAKTVTDEKTVPHEQRLKPSTGHGLVLPLRTYLALDCAQPVRPPVDPLLA